MSILFRKGTVSEEDLLEKQINAYYVDNESGYEDAIDTLTDFGDQEEIDDESINQSKQTKRNHTKSHIIDDINEDGGRETADTLADDMSMMSLDSSTDTSSRPSSSASFLSEGKYPQSSKIPVRTRRQEKSIPRKTPK